MGRMREVEIQHSESVWFTAKLLTHQRSPTQAGYRPEELSPASPARLLITGSGISVPPPLSASLKKISL